MGLTDAEFWCLTPKEYSYLVKRFGQEQERYDRRAALVSSVIANVNRNTKKRKRPYTVQDFMPRAGKKKSKKMTNNELLKKVESLNVIFGGTDARAN